MPLGYLSLVLHAHLPFVRHPEYEDFLEEDWLYEAITETYIPLLEVFDGLDRDGVDWRVTMSVTPTLAAMLADPLLQYRYVRHLDNLIALVIKELERTRWQPEFYPLAQMYHRRFTRAREVFVNQYHNNLLNGFRRFFETGRLELMTCAATHGFMPLMVVNENARRAQVEIGCREFERHFGQRPRGIWLAECGYIEGVDKLLKEAGLLYFFVDTHGVLFAEPRPKYGVYAPILCPGTNVAALARDTESSKQVWSAVEGYPGDFNYRDFYRDVGFDLDYEYLKPHLHQTGIRSLLGIKYFKITGRTDNKQPYDPKVALDRAAEHAGNFLFNREKQVEWLSGSMDRAPLIVAPYDAELFGHWWFEGPDWINFLLRKMHYDQQTVKPITVPEYHLDGQAWDVRVTSRLTTSPACIVANEPTSDINLMQRLRGSGLPSQPVLEINPKHPLVERLNRHQDDPRLADWASVLFNQAVLTLGARIDDPAAFVTRLNDLLTTLTDEPGSNRREVDADDGGTAAANDG